MGEQSEAGAVKTSAGAAGHATGKPKAQARGKTNKAKDADELYAQATGATAGLVEHARWMIETKPYTAVAIALGLGWLFGRTHRPL
jgi:hypothetical protein